MTDSCLIITATIDPKGCFGTHRQDQSLRREDYRTAFRKWLAAPKVPIVFVENSGSDLGDLKELAARAQGPVEFLSFNGEYDNSRGKGLGEMCALKYAAEHSLLFQKSRAFFKASGRLFIPNFGHICEQVKCSQSDLRCSLSDKLAFADSRFFFAKREFIKSYLEQYQALLDDPAGFYFEHALARAMHRAISDGWKWDLFRTMPRFEGVSASFKAKYNLDPIRRSSRRLLHSLKYKAFQV